MMDIDMSADMSVYVWLSELSWVSASASVPLHERVGGSLRVGAKRIVGRPSMLPVPRDCC